MRKPLPLITKARKAGKRICYALIFNAASSSNDRRAARNYHNFILKTGHPINVYKVCLITESHYLNQQSGAKNRAPAGPLSVPVADQLLYFLKKNISIRLKSIKTRLKGNLPRLKLLVRQKFGNEGDAITPEQAVAGVFYGLSNREVFNNCKDSLSDQIVARCRSSYFEEVNQEAIDLHQVLASLNPLGHSYVSPKGPIGKVGILISCFHPEKHIAGFLQNLLELKNPERLVPIIINAGMSEECKKHIHSTIEKGSFSDFIFKEKPGCGIYEAWNIGINACNEQITYLTNFNVDDRRHPYCLEIQASYLDGFQKIQVAITDYLYFFNTNNSISALYNANEGNRTFIPVTNKRTIVYRNLPHSSPMWRISLHSQNDCCLFDECYESAGDAEFWYKVSRKHQNPFGVISIPLSLYYQNPEGISTRPNTKGVNEHHICTRKQYLHIMSEIDSKVGVDFTKMHLNHISPEHLQVYAAASFLKKI